MDMASHGFVVACPEHSDGSSMAAYSGPERSFMPYRRFTASDGPEWDFRHAQLKTRLNDLDAACEALSVAAGGGGGLAPLQGSPVDFGGGIDLGDVQVTGHSFGGGTAVAWAMRHPGKGGPRRCLGIDAWMFSLDKKLLCDRERCPLAKDMPILFVDADRSTMDQSRRRFCAGSS